jgi:hypothetical protein
MKSTLSLQDFPFNTQAATTSITLTSGWTTSSTRPNAGKQRKIGRESGFKSPVKNLNFGLISSSREEELQKIDIYNGSPTSPFLILSTEKSGLKPTEDTAIMLTPEPLIRSRYNSRNPSMPGP